MICFTIPYPENFTRNYSLNSIYGGVHWTKRQRLAQEWHWTVKDALSAAKISHKPLKHPVAITFFWDDGLDIDNHGLVGKLTVDALKGWVLTDDSPRYFVAVSHCFWDGGEIKVEVTEVG